MDVEERSDLAAARVAAAIGEPARARMLFCLMDGRARTSTELAVVGQVSPSTASVHLQRLTAEGLIAVAAQGRHRYYRLRGPAVARVLEGLNVVAGTPAGFVPSTPGGLRTARTCYDHAAGTLAVALHDRLLALGWIAPQRRGANAYEVTAKGERMLAALGIDAGAARRLRRRFAYPCLDWSERRPHLGGAIAAQLLDLLLRKRWVTKDSYGRALSITSAGRRELHARFGIDIPGT